MLVVRLGADPNCPAPHTVRTPPEQYEPRGQLAAPVRTSTAAASGVEYMPAGTDNWTPPTQYTPTAPQGVWDVDRAGHRYPLPHTLGHTVEDPVAALPHRPAGQSMDTPPTQ